MSRSCFQAVGEALVKLAEGYRGAVVASRSAIEGYLLGQPDLEVDEKAIRFFTLSLLKTGYVSCPVNVKGCDERLILIRNKRQYPDISDVHVESHLLPGGIG